MAPRVRAHPHGLELEGAGVVPLYAGAMHYWRHPPQDWGKCLDAIKAMGLRLVDTYVPWGVHERGKDDFDFGQHDPRLEVARFIEMCGHRDLQVVLRPGPHINAELTYFGLPERVVWDPECQARTPRGNPVMLPIAPVAFPVPSYASDAFHDETTRWYQGVGEQLARLRWPDGPIVMVQVDNEGAMYFRDGPYDQDYHPDAVRLFRAYLRAKYKRIGDLRAAWGMDELEFVSAEPPLRFDARGKSELARHLDWMEFHEVLLAGAFERMRRSLEDSGLGELPMLHNFPLGEAATPLNPARVATSIDVVGLDYYHRASDHAIIARRTTELATRSEGLGQPAYGAEVGAGFPPWFAPIDEKDSLYTLCCALAYGLRGFSLYMAVDRDRWIGAPIDVHGNPRPFADRIKTLLGALEEVRFETLRRTVPVRLLVPRAIRRLARASHAFGPITPAFFNVLGVGWGESAFDTIGDEQNPVVGGENFLRTFEAALDARGVPYAYAGGETFAPSTEDARWIICPTAFDIKPELALHLEKLAGQGARVTVGPAGLEEAPSLELEPLGDRARADALVAKRIVELALPTYPSDHGAHVTVHEDAQGNERVIFAMNPTSERVKANVGLPARVRSLRPIYPPKSYTIERGVGGFEISLKPREVRVFLALLATLMLLLGCKEPPAPTPAPTPPSASASARPPLPTPTPDEAAETALDASAGLPDASLETKLACPAGTVSISNQNPMDRGVFCVTDSTAKGPQPEKHGPAITFHKSGAPHEVGRFEHGKRAGHWVVWSEHGRKESEGDFKDGLRDGLYVSFWPSGKRSAEAHYQAGKMHGETKTWDDKGRLMAIGQWADDKLVSQKEFAEY